MGFRLNPLLGTLDLVSDPATDAPLPLGVAAAVGTGESFARWDHVHPSTGLATLAAANAFTAPQRVNLVVTETAFGTRNSGLTDMLALRSDGRVEWAAPGQPPDLFMERGAAYTLKLSSLDLNVMTLTTANRTLTLEQTGDTFGPTRLSLQNRTGLNGALFEQAGAVALVDFGFKAGASLGLVRFETRGLPNTFLGNPEFQIGPTGPFPLVVAPIGVMCRAIGAADTPLRVKGAISQAEDHLRVLDATDAVLLAVDKNGAVLAANKGLAAQAYKTHNPASQSFPVGVTVLQIYDPPTGYKVWAPLRWDLPPKIGNVQPGIRFTFSDASTVSRNNTSIVSSLDERRDSVEFQKDNLVVTRIEFIADNVAAVAETQDLGVFKFEAITV